MAADPYLASRMVWQAKWFTVARAALALATLAAQLLLVRFLRVEDYAAYTVLVAATGVLVLASMLGTDRVVYRFVPPLRRALRRKEAMALMAGLLLARLALVVIAFAVLAAGAGLLVPRSIEDQLAGITVQCVTYGLALAATDSLAFFCNSLGLQRLQALLFLAAAVGRLAVFAALVVAGPLEVTAVADVVALAEVLLALALALLLLRELASIGAAPGAGWQFGFSLRELVRDSLGTQAAYMLALPFKGALLKLLVAAVAPPVVTASFGFFQTLADRAYQFMPVFMLKPMVEPALTSDYAQRRDIGRVRTTVGMILQANFAMAALGAGVLAGVGAPLVALVADASYADQVLLALLLCAQVTGMSVGEALLFALNPLGRASHYNRLWLYFALPFTALLALAAMQRSAVLLVLASTLPYYVVYAWLRWVNRESLLAGGLGIGLALLARLAASAAMAALAGRLLLQVLPGGWGTVLAATLACVAAFVGTLRATGLFRLAEVETVGAVSPRLARYLRAFAAA